jgi:hypothetical protein
MNALGNREPRVYSRLLKSPLVQGVAAGAVALTLCAGLLFWALRLWRADLHIPFGNAVPSVHDVEFNGMLVKSMVDTGWCMRNRFLGAPFEMQLYDSPPFDNLSMSMMKPISLFTSNYGAILNLYFLLTFPLTVIASLVAFRTFHISYPSAIVASTLFAFMPYHFMRGEGHIFLAAYYPVPLIAMVIVWIALGEPLQPQERRGRRWLPGGRLSWAIVIAMLVGSGERYQAFFACLLLCVAAVPASLRAGTSRGARLAVMLAGLIVLSGAVNLAPNIAYQWRHGRNTEAIVRTPREAELYGLKITEMLLPVSGHRIRYLAALKDRYLQWTEWPDLALAEAAYGRPGHGLANEADTASLGLVSGTGFVFLVGLLLFGPKADNKDLFHALATLTTAAVLIGTVGGGGSLFNFVVSPLFRGYNRLSIYLAFFSLFAVALLLDNLGRRLARVKFATAIWYAVLALVLCVGMFDQTTPEFVPPYDKLASEFSSDAQFEKEIEASVPRGAMIFQLPYVPFPERGPVNKMRSWDLFKGYLHSNGLKWSYGVMTGRPEERWAERFANEPLDQVVKTLAFAGFNGIYIDRYGYADSAAGLESALEGVLHESPLVSADDRLSFFNLTDFAKSLKSGYSTAQWRRLHDDAVRLPAAN